MRPQPLAALRRVADRLRRDDAGQGLAEYAVLIGVVAGMVALTLIFMIQKIESVLEYLEQWL